MSDTNNSYSGVLYTRAISSKSQSQMKFHVEPRTVDGRQFLFQPFWNLQHRGFEIVMLPLNACFIQVVMAVLWVG
jgi:hypothetical protein